MRRGFALALAVVLLAACTAPAATPGGAPSPTAPSSPNETATSTPAPTVEPTATTLVRTPEPIPTGSPQALAPAIRVVSQTFSVATAAPLIEVVGPFRTNAETELRSWVPYLLNGLDLSSRLDDIVQRLRVRLPVRPGPLCGADPAVPPRSLGA